MQDSSDKISSSPVLASDDMEASKPIEQNVRKMTLTRRILGDGKLYRFYIHPWTQVVVISIMCFCCPGMYNALTGMGGSGQVDPTVAANAQVALLSVGAVTGVLVVGPLMDLVGPKLCLVLGGWLYPLYSGSLLNFNHNQNAAFVIAAGALLGLGASLLWVPQGVVMTTYVDEGQRGRAIALFWIIFNLGGTVGSLASLGINFHSISGTVSDATYIAYIVIMIFGWAFGSLFVCPADDLGDAYHGERVGEVRQKHREKFSIGKVVDTIKFTFKIVSDWRILCLIPMFFNANVFYSYQQNSVNGANFNLRTRSLNSALYWVTQMLGGLLMGYILDIPNVKRRTRGAIGWAFLFVYGMVIWGGGLKFQLWADKRHAEGHKQDIDFREGHFIGPMFLYMFYGAYDALWQSFCYWMMGARSNSPAVSAILVGTYKSFQCVGGAMAWRINAQKYSALSQLAMNWGLTGGTLLIALPSVFGITETNDPESTAHVMEGTDVIPDEKH